MKTCETKSNTCIDCAVSYMCRVADSLTLILNCLINGYYREVETVKIKKKCENKFMHENAKCKWHRN